MDIRSIDIVGASEEGFEVEVTHPRTGDVLCHITVKGIYAKNVAEALGRAAQKLRNSPSDNNLMAKVLAQATVGWRGMVEDGTEIKFSTAEAERIYRDYPIIRKQVWEAASNEGNFLAG